MHVLLIEQDAALAAQISGRLTAEKFQCTVATSSMEGIKCLLHNRYGAIMLDDNTLPDDLEKSNIVAEVLEYRRGAPIMVLSKDPSDTAYIQAIMAWHVDDYFRTDPLNETMLIASLRALHPDAQIINQD